MAIGFVVPKALWLLPRRRRLLGSHAREVGLDLGWRARKLAGVKPEDIPPAQRVADKLAEMGRYGQKNNRGFYIYPEGSRAGTADPEVVKLVEQVSAEAGITRRPVTDDEVLKRCFYPLINEAAKVLKRAGVEWVEVWVLSRKP